MEVECKKCHRKFTDRINDYPMHVYNHKGEAVCKDCLMGMGVLPDHDAASHNTLLTETVRYMMRPF
jgi:hypothetical protein